jgi:type VI secretion system protein ImpM
MAGLTSTALAFGKIPAHGDFLRLGARNTTVDALDRWLQEGLAELKRQRGNLRDEDEAATPIHFVFAMPSAPEVLVGALVMSRDRVGRRYPLLVARAIQKRFLDPQDVPLWPVVWRELFAASAALAAEAAASLDGARLAERLDGLPPVTAPSEGALLRDHLRALSAQPAAEFWESLWGDAESPNKYAVVSRLLEAIRPGARATVPAFGLSFPLAGLGTTPASEAVWLAAVWRVLPRLTELPVLAWPTGPHGGRLLVFPAGAMRRSAASVLGGAANPRLIVEMDAPLARPTDAVVGLPFEVGQLLESPETPLAAFLDSL